MSIIDRKILLELSEAVKTDSIQILRKKRGAYKDIILELAGSGDYEDDMFVASLLDKLGRNSLLRYIFETRGHEWPGTTPKHSITELFNIAGPKTLESSIHVLDVFNNSSSDSRYLYPDLSSFSSLGNQILDSKIYLNDLALCLSMTNHENHASLLIGNRALSLIGSYHKYLTRNPLIKVGQKVDYLDHLLTVGTNNTLLALSSNSGYPLLKASFEINSQSFGEKLNKVIKLSSSI